MLDRLIQQYIEAGIIQFGRFQQTDGTFHPVAMNFLLLPSFPALMHATAQALVPLLRQTQSDRLLTTRDAIALGAVLAVESGIPLTYPYGESKAYTNAFVIEGAYDVGHPTTLLTYILANAADAHHIMKPARQVGLHVQDVLCLFSLGGEKPLIESGIRVHPLFDFVDSLNLLEKNGILPAPMREHILDWLQTTV